MSNYQVLVLDDEREIAEFVADVVELADISVCYISAFSALSEALHTDLKLIVLDLIMPERSGTEILQFLAQRMVEVELILMSGETTDFIEEARQQADELGLKVVGILQKPFFATDLEAVLQNSSVTSQP